METIAGPFHGYWLACYTVATAEGHVAYAKMCTERPTSPWDAPSAVRKVASVPHLTEAAAIGAVIAHTRRRLAWRAGGDLQMPLDHFDPL